MLSFAPQLCGQLRIFVDQFCINNYRSLKIKKYKRIVKEVLVKGYPTPTNCRYNKNASPLSYFEKSAMLGRHSTKNM